MLRLIPATLAIILGIGGFAGLHAHAGVTNIPANYAQPLRTAVQQLGVAPEDRTGYEREKFVHWIDADHDGCDTRYEVLIAEAVHKPYVGSGCYLTGGTWTSYYDRVTTTDPTDLDVDHVIPLAEAWDSGARNWDSATRERFANDLLDPRALVAVTSRSNEAKSDSDPTDWMPRYGQCRYVASWVAIKLRWSLTVDAAEKDTLTRLATRCPNSTLHVHKATVTDAGTPTSGPTPDTRGVALTQISYDPAGSDTPARTNHEWVLLTNKTNQPATLTGWTLRDAAGAVYTFGQYTLAPGARVKVHSGDGADNAGHRYAGWGYTWNNTGDTATLRNADGTGVDTCTYTPTVTGTTTC